MLVAFVMLLGPESFHNLSQADVLYANLNTASWANGDTIITYTYDNNGSVETKTTVTSSVVKEVVTYHYNLAGRLARVWTDTDSSSSTNTVDVVDYKYNDDGIRVEKYSFSVAQDFLDTGAEQIYATDQKTTTYLVDSRNHTGYAQVLEEWAVEGSSAVLTCYTLGDDVIAQTKSYWQFISPQWELQSTGNAQYLLYDGHGSTRQLAEYNTEVTIVDSFSYDGYGVLLQNEENFIPPNGTQDPGKVAQQATSMLYAGEQFDLDTQQYYLRARWYDSLSGRFNRMDPFAGNNQDPQSLHKYLYAHCNPVNGIDPTGQFTLTGLMTTMSNIGTLMSISMPVIAPVLTDFASFFIPQWLETAMTGQWPSAGLIGGSLAITGGSGIGLGGIGGGEILYALGTQKFVAYTYAGFTGGFMSGRGIGVTGTGYLGAVWGIRTSENYTGTFYSISIPFGHLGSKLRKSVAEKIAAGVMHLFGAPPQYHLINEANIAVARRISGRIGPRGNFLATIFWNDDGTVGGISLGVSLNIGKGLSLSAARTEYRQKVPKPIGDNLRIPF